MSQQYHGVVAASLAARALLVSIPYTLEGAPALPEVVIPRVADRTPTDQFVAAPLPGVALSPKDLKRIQTLQTA